MDTSVVNLMIDSVDQALLKNLQTLLASDDLTRAGLVRPGLLQDDPLRYGITILSFANDPDKPGTWRDELAKTGPGNVGDTPSYEMGHSQTWYRRFSTTIEMYWPGTLDRQTARQYANVVMSRARKTIWDAQPQNLFDTFSEYALELYVDFLDISDAGGPGQFIHHGKIWWSVLTAND